MSISPLLASFLGVHRDATLLAIAGVEILLLSTAFTQRDILIGLGNYKARPRGALIFFGLRLLFIFVLAGFGVLGVIIAVMCARLVEVYLLSLLSRSFRSRTFGDAPKTGRVPIVHGACSAYGLPAISE